MGRLRYSREEAEAEAIRRAAEFVAKRSDARSWQNPRAMPNPLVPRSKASKHPVTWLVLFPPVLPDGGAIDGGELFVDVDLEANTVELFGW
jgi:hypothetical protein